MLDLSNVRLFRALVLEDATVGMLHAERSDFRDELLLDHSSFMGVQARGIVAVKKILLSETSINGILSFRILSDTAKPRKKTRGN